MSAKVVNPLIVALDVGSEEKALDVCRSLGHLVKIFKVGLTLFLAAGDQVIDNINSLGHKVFLDLKLCDIPFQASSAAEQIAEMNIAMFTVHTMGGLEMMKRVVDSTEQVCQKAGIEKPLILGVTVLTSWDQNQMQELGIDKRVEDQVLYLARLAQVAGLDGVVASAQEIRSLRQALGEDFLIVTPGIRPSWAEAEDQRRVLAPRDAIAAGANYIVVGRPILRAQNPSEVASRILSEIYNIS